MGGAPPPRSGCAYWVVSHFPPRCNTFGIFRPTFVFRRAVFGPEEARVQGFGGGARTARDGSPPHDLVQRRGMNGVLRPLGPRPTLWRAFRRWMWEGLTEGTRPACSAPPCSPSSAPSRRSPPRGAAAARPAAATPIRPRWCRPGVPVYIEASVRPEGELREDALAAAGKLLSTPDPAGRLRELLDEQLAEEASGRELGARPGAVARREGRRVGVGARSAGADRRGDHREHGCRRRASGDRAARRRPAAARASRARTRRSRTRSTTTGTAVGVVDDWVVTGTETRLQAHGRRARGRSPRRRRALHAGRRRARGGSARPLLRRSARAAGRRAQAEPVRDRPARPVQVVLPGRQARPDHRCVHRRRRGHGVRHRALRPARGADAPARRAGGRRRDRAAREPPGRRLGRVRDAARSARRWRSWSTRSPARSAARP